MSIVIYQKPTCTTCRQVYAALIRKVIEAGATYYTCNGYWYQPVYKGKSVTYVVVNQP